VVADQYGAPTWSRDLARMTAEAIGRCEAQGGGELQSVLDDAGGIYHAAGAGETTWYGFAEEAVRLQQEREPGVRFAAIEAITTAEYPTPAKRPANSRMSCERLKERFGWEMLDWRDSLREVLAEL
jgi:dTDP-4-dehydrorhamnose reductase